MKEVNPNLKTPDTEADTLIRAVVAAAEATRRLVVIAALDDAINKARWYLEKKDSCDFQTEEGLECRDPATRCVHGMWCCERHASMRERY
jgi:hypothetical protein